MFFVGFGRVFGVATPAQTIERFGGGHLIFAVSSGVSIMPEAGRTDEWDWQFIRWLVGTVLLALLVHWGQTAPLP